MKNVSDNARVKKLSEDEGDKETSASYLYTVDLSSIELSFEGESEDSTWIQAMPLGTWIHPIHGAIVISKDRVKQFADNVNDKVRDRELDIDYDHKKDIARGGEAAGWVKQAKVITTGPPGQRGLHILVEWTKTARQEIKDRKFRFFSPEFRDKWKHPGTGVIHKDVLFGGALTNRPFLTNILPINLSELTEANETDTTESEDDMDRKILETFAGNLKVDFTKDTSDADLQKLVTDATASTGSSGNSDDGDDGGKPDGKPEKDPVKESIAASEDAALTKLAETNPAVALLLAEREANAQRLEVLEITNKLSEAKVTLSEVGDEKTRLSPAIKGELAKILVGLPTKLSESLVKVLDSLVEGKATVQLGEIGSSNDHGSDDGNADEVFNKSIKALMEGEDGLSFGDAVVQASMDNPEQADGYRRNAYSFGAE